jgi:hypothetical protein
MSPAKRAQAGGDRPTLVLSTVMESMPKVFQATRPRYPLADNVTSAGPALLEPRSHKVAGFQCDDTTESTRDDGHMSACAALGRSPTQIGDRLESARTNKGRLREPNRCYVRAPPAGMALSAAVIRAGIGLTRNALYARRLSMREFTTTAAFAVGWSRRLLRYYTAGPVVQNAGQIANFNRALISEAIRWSMTKASA